MITHAAENKDRTLGSFAFKRVTRIYSVVVPALILTFLADEIGTHLAPSLYSSTGASVWPICLSFFNEIWFLRIYPGSNAPYWSISYEVWYYAIFAAAFYLYGSRRLIWVFTLCLLSGPAILTLMPAWLAGVYVYYRLKSPLGPWTSVLASVAPIVIYTSLLYFGTMEELGQTAARFLGYDFIAKTLGESAAFPRQWLVAVLVALHFVGVGSILKRRTAKFRDSTEWLASATFSLYITHVPILAVAYGLTESPVFLLTTPIIVSLIFAWAFERRLRSIRRGLLPVWEKTFTKNKPTSENPLCFGPQVVKFVKDDEISE